MRITQEADYAIRIVLFLSILGKSKKTEAQVISDAENIPDRFTLKILRKLNQAQITKSFRGVNGGYILIKCPDEISLKDIVEAIDGKIAINKCLIDGSNCNLNRASYCSVHKALENVQNTISNELEKVKFSDLINQNC